jgi:hypothetical protein
MTEDPVFGISDDALAAAALSEGSRACIERLRSHRPERFDNATNRYVVCQCQ